MAEPVDEFSALLAQVHLGNAEALTSLIGLYEPDIQRAAHVLLGRALRSSLDPVDLVQSVHVRLIGALKEKKLTLGSPEHLRSLALKMLRNTFIQHWRRHRRESRHGADLAGTIGHTDENALTAHLELDPARAAEYNDSLDHLYGRLRSEDRQLVMMRLQGYRGREIAAELGIAPNVLRVRLSRLRHRLRREKPLTDWA